jgi:cyanophycin synthetase
VVVKPSDGNHARGVFTNLMTAKKSSRPMPQPSIEGSGVIVERYVRGSEHRLLVVGGKLIAAARGETAKVVGDGESTIDELIDAQINSDPRRGRRRGIPARHHRTGRQPGGPARSRAAGLCPGLGPAEPAAKC